VAGAGPPCRRVAGPFADRTSPLGPVLHVAGRRQCGETARRVSSSLGNMSEPFFNAPVHDVAAVRYRHDVLRDLEKTAVFEAVGAFAREMRRMGESSLRRRSCTTRIRRNTGFLSAVQIYCDAVRSLADELTRIEVTSLGFHAFGVPRKLDRVRRLHASCSRDASAGRGARRGDVCRPDQGKPDHRQQVRRGGGLQRGGREDVHEVQAGSRQGLSRQDCRLAGDGSLPGSHTGARRAAVSRRLPDARPVLRPPLRLSRPGRSAFSTARCSSMWRISSTSSGSGQPSPSRSPSSSIQRTAARATGSSARASSPSRVQRSHWSRRIENSGGQCARSRRPCAVWGACPGVGENREADGAHRMKSR
jgi:hypothetical protein